MLDSEFDYLGDLLRRLGEHRAERPCPELLIGNRAGIIGAIRYEVAPLCEDAICAKQLDE
jgi:hypothetical protein